MTWRVASAIHWLETMAAPGPQKWKCGKVPSFSVRSSCGAGGEPVWQDARVSEVFGPLGQRAVGGVMATEDE